MKIEVLVFGVLNLPWTFFNFGQAFGDFFSNRIETFFGWRCFFSLRRKLEKQERGLPIINEQIFVFFLGGVGGCERFELWQQIVGICFEKNASY